MVGWLAGWLAGRAGSLVGWPVRCMMNVATDRMVGFRAGPRSPRCARCPPRHVSCKKALCCPAGCLRHVRFFPLSLSLSLSHAAFSMPFCLVLSSSCILLQLSEYSSNISVKLNKIPSLLSPGGWPFFSLWISHHNWNYILKFPFYRFIILVLSLFCFFPFKISILFCFNLSQVLFSIYVIHWWHDWIVIR